MLKKTIVGISKALHETFKKAYAIHIDNIEQDLNTPCFKITSLNPSQEQRLGKRYERFQPFDIIYFPNNEKECTCECMEVTEKLFDVLEYISIDGDLVRGINMSAEIQDGILHFFVDFNMFVIKQQERINMNDINSDVSLKEDD